ncbi:MAG: DUF2029 domain-containing protein [Deltaproteobacteria bacterium]|nr:DUF2029 domain-containing protein [Deltaproteobacteria bacterium]
MSVSYKHTWGASGLGLCFIFLYLSWMSREFGYGIADIEKPIISLVLLLIGAGALYLLSLALLRKTPYHKVLTLWVIAVGIFLRLSMFSSAPMLEDDHYRYLWDGAVLAKGFNPYRYSPRDILDKKKKSVPGELRQLAQESGPVIERINHPWLRTIYPPVDQVAFALAYLIKPWSLNSWRLILFALDLITLYLLFHILRKRNLPPHYLAIYWWSPILIKEIYNSGHMEVIIMPFLLGVLLFAIERRYILASAFLGLAAGTKFWPAILMIVLLRPLIRNIQQLAWAALVFAVLFLLALLPFYLTGLDPRSGLTAYGKYWEMNDALFMLILWAAHWLIGLPGLNSWNAQGVARVLVFLMVISWTLWICRKQDCNPLAWNHRFLMVTAGLFLLSPTQFPWYSLWLLPFLTIQPRFSLLLLTLCLPIYYLRFYFEAKGLVGLYDNTIVWFEYLPVWLMILLDWYKNRSGPGIEAGESA